MESVQAKITANGQVSLPAAIRRRWGSQAVLVIDRGTYAIVRPIPEDPIGALAGAYAGPGPSPEEVRSDERAADAQAEERRSRRSRRLSGG